MSELKPCPFCGSHDGIRVHATRCRSSEPHAAMYHAEVWHFCGLVKVSADAYDESKGKAMEKAIGAWNRRTKPEYEQPTLAGLEVHA